MNTADFRQYLQTRKLAEDEIRQHLALVEQFEEFLQASASKDVVKHATSEDVRNFVDRLVQTHTDTFENILALARYGRFIKNNAMSLAALELIDGGEVMDNLHAKLGNTLGAQTRDEIFQGLTLPTLGTPNTQRARLMQTVMERLEHLAGTDTCRQLLADSLRDLPEAHYLEDKRRYAECGDFDAFLELKRQEFLAELEQIKTEGSLFFNQEITAEVIAFVRNDPEISQGVRHGNVLYVTKIPYMTKEYLAETDAEQKRYYYCHCPWVRESLRRGEVPVSATFCQCSAGFHKKPWEIIFGQPLQAEVLESVLQGDLRCRFAIHLPPDLLTVA